MKGVTTKRGKNYKKNDNDIKTRRKKIWCTKQLLGDVKWPQGDAQF